MITQFLFLLISSAFLVVILCALLANLLYLHSSSSQSTEGHKSTVKPVLNDVAATLSSTIDFCCREWIGAGRNKQPLATASSTPIPRSKLVAATTTSGTTALQSSPLPPPRRDVWWKILRYYCQHLTEIHARKLVTVDCSRLLLFTGFVEVLNR